MTDPLYPRHGNSGPAPGVTPPGVLARGPNGARWLYLPTTITLPGGLFGEFRAMQVFPGWVADSILRAIKEQDPTALEPP